MQETQVIREAVSRAYTRAVAAPDSCGCCGPVPKGTLARHAGYGHDELAALPEEAVSNSLGCGNPLAFSQVRPGEVVLDLGCGAGIDVVLAARKAGPAGRVIGVDMTDAMIAKARAVIAQAGLTNAEIRKGIIEELPVETASVDWVISNCVINLSPEKPRVFAEIARVLKPGGRVMVSDILTDGLPEEVRQNLVLYSSCVAGAISEREYREGLERVGLTDVRIRKRLDLDLAQFEALLESDKRVSDSPGSAACATSKDASGLAAACVGNVWSAEISARKPG